MLLRSRYLNTLIARRVRASFPMTTATALPYPEAFEKTWNNFHSWIQTPRNRRLFEAAWLTPEAELASIRACFEWAGESWDRDSGEVQQLVWDAFIDGEQSDFGSEFKGMALMADMHRPDDVTEDGKEKPSN